MKWLLARDTSATSLYSEIAPNEILAVCDDVAKWFRIRTKSRYDGMKINVPPLLFFLLLLLLPLNFFTNDDNTVVVKYLNLASGSLVGEILSNRENTCFTGIGSNICVIAPSYIGDNLTLPEKLFICDENNELISGVIYGVITIVCRKFRAWLSKYHVRTRLKSHPCASFGCRLSRWKMYSTWSQFCI